MNPVKVHCVGETTAAGRIFIATLASAALIDPKFVTLEEFKQESSPEHFLPPAVAFIEHTKHSQALIHRLREHSRPFFFIWYGSNFTKNDVIFGIEARAYAVFENLLVTDPYVTETLKQLNRHLATWGQFENITQSIRSVVMQAETSDEKMIAVEEMKSVIQRLEKLRFSDELLGAVHDQMGDPLEVHAEDLGDVLTTIETFERTGVLWVQDTDTQAEGQIEVIRGKIVSAQTGVVRCLKAIHRMFLWEKPKFVFDRKDLKPHSGEEPLEMSVRYLCLEGKEYRQRYHSMLADLPPRTLKIALEPSALSPKLKLSEEDFFTLASVVEFGRVADVLDYNSLPDAALYESLIRLRKESLIRVVA